MSQQVKSKADRMLVDQVIDTLFELSDYDSRKFDKLLLRYGITYFEDLEDWEEKDLLKLKKELEKLI